MNRWLVVGLCVASAMACSRTFEAPEPPKEVSTGYITGHLLTETLTGALQPAQGATASVVSSNLRVAADGQGAFVLGPLPVGVYAVLLTDQSQGASQSLLVSPVQVRAGLTQDLGALTLNGDAEVDGRIVVADGGSILGATAFVPAMPYTATATADGDYALLHLPAGALQVEAFAPGSAVASTGVMSLVGGTATRAQDLVLVPQTDTTPGTLSGTVVVTDRTDASGVSVQAFSFGSATATTSVTTAADGSFSLSAPAALYTLRFTLRGFRDR